MGNMTIGLCCRDVPGLSLEAQFEQAKRLGFDRVQIALWRMEHLNEESANETNMLLRKYGLICTEIWCGWQKPAMWDFKYGPSNLGLVPAEYRAIRTQNLLDGAAYARVLGVSDVITHLGFIPVNPLDPDYTGLIIALKHITAEYAKYEQFFSFETGQEPPVVVKRCIEDVGAQNMGVNYDPANLMIYGNANALDGLQLLGPYVRSVHAKDGTYPTGGYLLGEETVLGEGDVQIAEFIERLKELGYSGTLSIEHERKNLTLERKEEEILIAKKLLESLL